MDAFEQVVGEILWREGYWVRTSVKVELTKDDKRAIGLAYWHIYTLGLRLALQNEARTPCYHFATQLGSTG